MAELEKNAPEVVDEELPVAAPAKDDQTIAAPVSHPAETLAPADVPASAPVAPPAAEIPMVASPDAAPKAQLPLQGPSTPAQTAQFLKGQDSNWAQDLANQHVTPQTYGDLFAKRDTLGKIGALFGLLVSGVGAGLTNQPNVVLGMMDKQIQNDLEAQKTSKTNAQNFIKMNQEHQLQESQIGLTGAQTKGYEIEAKTKADALAHMQMNRAAFHTLSTQVQKLAAAAAADPSNPQKADQLQKAQQALGVIGAGIDAQNSNIADKAAATTALLGGLSNSTKPGEEDQFGAVQQGLIASGDPKLHALAEDRASKYIPGIGQGSVASSGEDRNKIISGVAFQKQLQSFMDWSRKHSGDLSPTDYKYGQTLASNLQNSYRDAMNGGVFKEGEQKFISSIIDSTPTKFFNSIRVMPQLKAVQEDSVRQLNSHLASKGLPKYNVPKAEAEEPKSTGPAEGATATSVSGKPMIFTKGKWVYK